MTSETAEVIIELIPPYFITKNLTWLTLHINAYTAKNQFQAANYVNLRRVRHFAGLAA
jgi:hypothetical protein